MQTITNPDNRKTFATILGAGVATYSVVRLAQAVLCDPPCVPEPAIERNAEDGFAWSWVKRFLYRHFYVVRKGDHLLNLHQWCNDFSFTPFMMKIFFRPHIVLSDPDDIEQVLLKQDSKFYKGAGYDIARIIVGKAGLLSISNNDEHARHRRILMPVFSSQNVRAISNEITRIHALRMLGGLFERIQQGGEEDAVVNLSEHLFRMALSAVGDSAFRATRNESLRVRQHFDTILKLKRVNYFCPMYHTPSQRRARKILTEISGELIDKNMRMRHVGNVLSVMDVLIDELYVHFSMQDVLDHLITFLFAGHDTSSHTLEFLFALLGTHPEVQDRLFEELEDLMPSICSCPTVEELKECAYLVAVVREGFRMFPAAPVIYRDAAEDVYLPHSGVVVPKGYTAVVSIFSVQRNRHIYGDDADVFRPERWLGDEGRELQARLGRCGYIPFSCGKRSCIGQEFGYLEVLIATALIGRHLKVELVSRFPQTRYVFTMLADRPVEVRIRARPGISAADVYRRIAQVMEMRDEEDGEGESSNSNSNSSGAIETEVPEKSAKSATRG